MCRVLNLPRSTYCYEAQQKTDESELVGDLALAQRALLATPIITKDLETPPKSHSTCNLWC